MNNEKMREAWARSVSNEKYWPFKDKIYGNKVRGRLFGVHYLVYNILRELPKERGFEPSGKGFEEAQEILRLWTKELSRYNSDTKSWYRASRIDELLFPFENEVTAEDLRALL